MIEITIDVVSRIGLSTRRGRLRIHEARKYPNGWTSYDWIFNADRVEHRGTSLQREGPLLHIGYLVLGSALEQVARMEAEAEKTRVLPASPTDPAEIF